MLRKSYFLSHRASYYIEYIEHSMRSQTPCDCSRLIELPLASEKASRGLGRGALVGPALSPISLIAPSQLVLSSDSESLIMG